MSEDGEDILVPIPDEDLPALAKIYKGYMDVPQIYSSLRTLIKWKKCEESNPLMNIYSPKNCWKNDGSFIIMTEFGYNDLVIFSFDENCKALLEGLSKTNRIDFNKPWYFSCFHRNHLGMLTELAKLRNLKMFYNYAQNLYSVRSQSATNFNCKCPPEIYIKELNHTEAPDIGELLPKVLPNYKNYFSVLIAFNGGYGVYLKSDDTLIAWGIINSMGLMAFLETSEHRFKGYDVILAKTLCKKILEDGENPLTLIPVINKATHDMFEKLGARNRGLYSYIGVRSTEMCDNN